ncbi:MAG: hypothetical protein OIF55_13535 [Amphritea sp.]|nr:hypothetical protein [Amphritea sp.]
MDRPQLPRLNTQPQTRLLLLAACMLFGGLLIASLYLSFVTGRIAEQQVRDQGRLLGQQTVNLLRPALLSADPVSLNFVLNQQSGHPFIEAIILKDTKDRLLGRAGETTRDNLIQQEITISQQEQPLAYLELHLNPAPYHYQLNTLMIQALILALIVIIATLLALWQWLKRTALSTTESEQDSAASIPPEIIPVLTETEPEEPEYNDANRQEDDLLVDLLKPADDAPEMPEFAPFSDHKEISIPVVPTAEEKKPVIEEISITPKPAGKPESKLKNPLFENDKHEVQLDLYAFEKELELIVAADQAGYLLYLDLASGHSDNISATELEEMQEYYSRMLDMVIAIYQGEAAKISNGDLQLAFLKPHKDDSHGVNAICASQLFNRLYKLFNQQRIRQMKPVLNLHMALVRGHHKKLPRLQEEARFLTQSTDSNELITHTALSEAPDLKVSLLAGADIHRAEEDKVLIHSVNDNYQMLLDKQARHLLKKLFP